MGHQHESWMIQESAGGGYYCAACGEDVEFKHRLTTEMQVASGQTCVCGYWAKSYAEWREHMLMNEF